MVLYVQGKGELCSARAMTKAGATTSSLSCISVSSKLAQSPSERREIAYGG